MKLLPSLVLYHSLSVFQSTCTLFILYSMCLYSNLSCPTLSPREYNYYNQCLQDIAWRRAKSMTTQSAALQQSQLVPHVVSATTLLYPNNLLILYVSCTVHGFLILSSHFSIYSIDTLLYSYALPFIQSPLTPLKSLPKCNLSSSLRL